MTNQYLPLILKIEAFLKGEVESVDMPEVFNELRYEMIQRAIVKSGGNNAKAARMLGIKRTNFLYHIGQTKRASEKELREKEFNLTEDQFNEELSRVK